MTDDNFIFRSNLLMMGGVPEEPSFTFRGGTAYWDPYAHSVKASHMRASAKRRWGLIGGNDVTDGFPIPKKKGCESIGLYCTRDHIVSEEAVYVYVTDVLGMKPNIVERVVEKIVERGYVTTIEKHEVLSFALTRELRLTQGELRRAHESDDADYALRLAGRAMTIREVMTDLGAVEMAGGPEWMLVRGNDEPEEDAAPEPQMEMFSAV